MGGSKIVLDIIFKLWYLWLLLLLAALLNLFKPTIKGWFGEKTIAFYLHRLPQEEYTVINDIILPTETGTTQIDHIVVSLYGVFVIETKNYKGWIYGSEKSAQWTQNIYGKKSSFMNPIRQNFAHVKAVEALITQFPSFPIIPIVAFSPNCDLKVKTTSHVVYFQRVYGVIRKYTENVVNNDDIASIVGLLHSENINSAMVKKEHVNAVSEKKTKVEAAVAGGKCPKCEGTIVERHGKYGSFLGCSNYPKCRFTKQI